MTVEFFGYAIENFGDQLIVNILAGIIVTLIFVIPTVLFNKKIRKFIRKYYFQFTDSRTGISAIFTQKYDNPPTKYFDTEIFNELQNQIKHDKISKVMIKDHFLRIYSENLGMKLDILLNEEPDLMSLNEHQIKSYNVDVKMDAQIKGVKQISRLQYFIDTALNIQHIIQLRCFANETVRQSFIICDLNQISNKLRNENIEDHELSAHISFVDNHLAITSTNPQTITKTVKKYAYA